MPLDEALEIGAQIAEALAAAHRASIIHRDLKPGNIMLTKSGVKLLDFGLAKLKEPVGGQVLAATTLSAPTQTTPLTGQGTILGTLQYMAPEQLEGNQADARTDIWALGLVLYEMLTGERAFNGQTQASLIAAILERRPTPLTSINPVTPPALDRLVLRCLSRDPDERWESAHDVSDELRWIRQTGATVAASTRRGTWQQVATAAAFAALGAASGAMVLWNRPSVSRPTVRSVIEVSPADGLHSAAAPPRRTDGRPFRTAVALTPDGRTLVFSGVQGNRRQLYIRPLDRLHAEPLAGTDGAESAFFSPDGQWVAYWAHGELRKTPRSGGPSVSICPLDLEPIGATWDAAGRIVFGRLSGGLWQVSASGGRPERLTMLDDAKGEVSHRLPHMLPGGDVLFTITHNRFPRWTDTRLAVFSRQSHAHKVVLEGGADGRYVSSGHLVYVLSGALMAVPFDLHRLEVTGASVGLVSDVMQSAYGRTSSTDTGAGQFSVSGEGTLVYLPGSVVPDERHFLYWVDRTGHAERLPVPPGPFNQLRIAPDGEHVAFHTEQAQQDIWIYDLVRRNVTRLTTEGRNATPVWSPDGQRIVYRSSMAGPDNLFWLPVNSKVAPQRLTTTSEHEVPAVWSSAGDLLAFYRLTDNGIAMWTLSVDGNRTARKVMEVLPLGGVDFSPDGKWLAYATRETGRWEVYVEAFPSGTGRQQVSIDAALSPVWRHDGRELFFVSPRSDSEGFSSLGVMATAVSIGPVPRFGAPRLLFEGPYEFNYPARNYDVAPDGQHFVLLKREQTPAVPLTQLVVVQNWFEELKVKVPGGK